MAEVEREVIYAQQPLSDEWEKLKSSLVKGPRQMVEEPEFIWAPLSPSYSEGPIYIKGLLAWLMPALCPLVNFQPTSVILSN